MTKCVLEARDEYEKKKNKRNAQIKKYVPVISCMCLSFVICFTVWNKTRDFEVNTSTSELSGEISNVTLYESETENSAVLPVTDARTVPESSSTSNSSKTDYTVNEHTEITKPQTEAYTNQLSGNNIYSSVPSLSVPENTQTILIPPAVTEKISSETEYTAPAETSGSSVQNSSGNISETTTEQISSAETTSSVPDNEVPSKDNEGDEHHYLHWNEMTINQQYFMAEFGEPLTVYSTLEKEISAGEVGEYICKAYMSGYDWYELIYYHCEAEAYRIKGDNEGKTIAVKFSGDDKYYIYSTGGEGDDEIDG